MKLYTFKPLLAAVALALPVAAYAESNFQSAPSGALTATARVDFTIVVPRILFLRVGTGSSLPYASDTTVNLITFNVPAATMGNGTPVAATATSGDLSNGTVTARLISNVGAVTFSVSTPGAISNGTDTINYTEITTATAALAGVALPLAAPALVNGAGGTTSIAAISGVVNRGSQWTYAYANTNPVPSGSYGGVGGVNNGRATYTAVSP